MTTTNATQTKERTGVRLATAPAGRTPVRRQSLPVAQTAGRAPRVLRSRVSRHCPPGKGSKARLPFGVSVACGESPSEGLAALAVCEA
jgi:hypothetical protein